MRKRLVLVSAVVIIAVGTLFVFWKVREAKAKASRVESEILKELTADDVRMILENQATVDATKTMNVVHTVEARKAFLDGLREHLALAARARREGMGESEDFRLTCEYRKNTLLAELYFIKRHHDARADEGKGRFEISKEQIETLWNYPENEKQLRRQLEAIRAVQKFIADSTENPFAASGELQGEALEKTRKAWGQTKILSDMAKTDSEFINQRGVYLRLKIVEAGLLSSLYINKSYAANIKASKEDLAAYLAAHPEYDLNQKRQKAEMVLRRAKAGEDFAQLAQEFSEDRSTKNAGGIYRDEVMGGGAWYEIQRVIPTLENGQIAAELVETKDGFHIVKLIDKETVTGDNGEETLRFTFAHILFQRRFEEPGPAKPNIPPPFMAAEEIATAEIQKEKRARFVGAIVKSENISLPDDFHFEVTERLKNARDFKDQIQSLVEKEKLKNSKGGSTATKQKERR